MSERMLSRDLQPPRSSLDAITAADEYAELLSQRKDALIYEAMRGEGSFYNTDPRDPDCYDAEQQQAVFELVQRIIAMPTIKPETRWLLFMTAMREGEVERYAEARTRT